MERFTWNQDDGNNPTIEQLRSMLSDVYSVMANQLDDNGETVAQGNMDLFTEVGNFIDYTDACHFSAGEVTFREEKKS